MRELESNPSYCTIIATNNISKVAKLFIFIFTYRGADLKFQRARASSFLTEFQKSIKRNLEDMKTFSKTLHCIVGRIEQRWRVKSL
jgi:hypothetical protein